MLIDKNEKNRKSTTRLLEKNSFNIIQLASKEDLIKPSSNSTHLNEAGIQLIIINVTQGISDISQTCKLIHNHLNQEFKIPILLIVNEKINTANLESSEIIDSIYTPFSENEILYRINKSIENHKLKQKLAQEREENLSIIKQIESYETLFGQLAHLDKTTALPNYLYFENILEKEFRRSSRNNYPLVLIIIDIDFFKDYIDLYGREASIKCLLQINDILKPQINRPGDLLARFSDGEFAILLPDSDLLGGTVFAELLRTSVANSRLANEKSTLGYITISIGVAHFDHEKEGSFKTFIKDAFQALSTAKRQGGNKIISA